MIVHVNVPDEAIAGALSNARSRYWVERVFFPGVNGTSEGWIDVVRGKGRAHVFIKQPGGGLARALECPVTQDSIAVGVTKLAADHPLDFAHLLSDLHDGIVGDVLLQLVTTGEVQFG